MSRRLSDDLVARLRCARELERFAESEWQARQAIYGTAALLQAAVNAGWRLVELAPHLGISAGTASKRMHDARRAGRMAHPGGLVVDPAPATRRPLDELAVPIDDRQWLGRAEAADYLGLSARTVHSLYEGGLLPNTRDIGLSWRAYLRADLDRVRNAPRRGPFLDRVALRARIASSQA